MSSSGPNVCFHHKQCTDTKQSGELPRMSFTNIIDSFHFSSEFFWVNITIRENIQLNLVQEISRKVLVHEENRNHHILR